MMMNYHLMTIQKKHIPHRMCFFCMYVLLRYIGWFTFFKLAFFYVCSHLPVYSSPTFLAIHLLKLQCFTVLYCHTYLFLPHFWHGSLQTHISQSLHPAYILPRPTKIKYAFFYNRTICIKYSSATICIPKQ